MKKSSLFLLIAVIVILVLAAVYFIGSGFTRATSVFISDYSLSEDGSEMTFTAEVGSSAGFVRKVSVHEQHDGRLYLDFYSAFGGINGSIGAKNEFTVPLSEDITEIVIYRNPDCYQVVLQKDADGSWQRIN